MKKTKFPLFFIILIFFISSCTKEEFGTNKGLQTTSITSAGSASAELCAQSTLVSPQVDILILWDNTSSFNFVTSATKSSMSKLISSVSERFDYHILNAPLVPANSASLYEMSLIVKKSSSVSGNATTIIKTKDQAIANLGFTQGTGAAEAGIDRAYNIITTNRSNGIFRNDAYTIIVVMSNEDDKGCELSSTYNTCTKTDKDNYLVSKKQKFLCLRGNQSIVGNCSGTSLNSTMMRFINISPLTSCTNGLNQINYNYRSMAKYLYEATYSNGWPTSADHLNPDLPGYPDSYNLCSIDFSHIFDGVNTAIKETLIKHVYSYWPVAGSTESVDPDSLVVTRDDGKILVNRTGESNPPNGFAYINNQVNHATRSSPTSGEPFTGKMIQLFGSNNNDLIIYPHCLKVTYEHMKSKYGYIYLQNGEPYTPSIEVTINGAIVPQSTTNGWSYMGLQFINGLDANLKVANLPSGTTSGYIIQLNGTYQVTNATNVEVKVYYTSKAN